MIFYSFIGVAAFSQAPELFLQYARSKGLIKYPEKKSKNSF